MWLSEGDRVIMLQNYRDRDVLIRRGTVGIVVGVREYYYDITWIEQLGDKEKKYGFTRFSHIMLGNMFKEIRIQPGHKVVMMKDTKNLYRGEVGIVTGVVEEEFGSGWGGLCPIKFYMARFIKGEFKLPFRDRGSYYREIKKKKQLVNPTKE